MKFVLVLALVAAVTASSYWSGAQTHRNDFDVSAGGVYPYYSAISADPSANRLKYVGWHVEGQDAFILAYTPWCTPAPSGGSTQNCGIFPFWIALPATAGANAPGTSTAGFQSVTRLTATYNWPRDFAPIVYADAGQEITWTDRIGGDYRSSLFVVDTELKLWSWSCGHEDPNSWGAPNLMTWDACNQYALQNGGPNAYPPALVVSSGGHIFGSTYWYCNAAYIDSSYGLWYGAQSIVTNTGDSSSPCAWVQVSSSVGNHTVGFHSVANGVDVVFAIDQNGNIRSTPVVANTPSLPSWDTWTDITSQWTSTQQATYGNLFFVDSYDLSRTYFVANNASGTPQNTLWRYDSAAGTFNGPIQVGGSTADTGVGPAPDTFSGATATNLWNPNWASSTTYNVGNAAISVGPDAVYVSDLNSNAVGGSPPTANLGDTWRYAHGAPF